MSGAEEERRGIRRLATGAGLGLAGGLAAIVIPIAFLWLALYNPGGFFTFGVGLIQATSVLVLAGAILFLLSFLFYRRAFSVLRKVDGRFAAPAALCILGSIGFLLFIVMAAVLFGSSSSLVSCIHGRPTQLLGCLRSGQELGAYTGLLGIVLGWLGGVGIVLGVARAGGRYRQGSLYGGAVLYGLLLVAIVGPLSALVVSLPGVQYLLLTIPVWTILAPGLVFAGAERAVPRAPVAPYT